MLPVAIQSTWAALEDGSEAILGPECCGRSSNELKVISPCDMFTSGAVLIPGCNSRCFFLPLQSYMVNAYSEWNPI